MIFFSLLFFVSGFCSLVYETVWLRMAMGTFGVTAPFVSIFLSVFMMGLGLGSWGAGALCHRLRAKTASYTMRLYAGAELLIAFSAFAVPMCLAFSRNLLANFFGSVSWGSSGYYWVSGLCTVVTLLPWCVCMGATFPLAMATIEKSLQTQSKNSFSFLYLANVIGAGLGTVLAAFILIEAYGFHGTLLVTATLNAAAAAFALTLSFQHSLRVLRSTPAAAISEPDLVVPLQSNVLPLLFITGLVSMAMEVVWTRQFTPYLGNSIYTFALILGIYLTASFTGSCLYRAGIKKGFTQYDGIWIISGALCLLPVYAADPYLPLNAYVRIALGIVPFCCLLGFLTPSLLDQWSSGNPSRAGTAYAVNILGCIIGPLIAGFFLLPRMAERNAVAILALPFFIIGLLSARRQRTGLPALGRLGSVGLYALSSSLAAIMFMSTNTFEDKIALLGGNIRIQRDYQATVTAAGSGFRRLLLVNGTGMTGLGPITKIMAHLPLVFLSREPKNSLVICFGMGTTFRSMLSWGISSTAVELVPSVPLLFDFFHKDAAQLIALPNARVVIDDGRRFLARSPETYNVITIDPAPPVTAAGSSFLYSEEFYAAVNTRLKPDGIMQQWILEPLDPIVLSAFAKAIKNSFPYVRVFRSVEGWGYHCLASRSPIPSYTPEVLAARMPQAAVKDLIEFGPYPTGIGQFRALLNAEIPISTLISPNAQSLQDDRPVNEYYFLRTLRVKFK